MRGPIRKLTFALPFGAFVAIATHYVRFGEDHAFGGSAHEALVSAVVGGAIAIALVILHGFLVSGTTTTTGTIAAARARSLLPGAPFLFVVATSVYYGIELLEGNGIDLGPATLGLAAFSLLVAYALRRLTAICALFVADLLRDWLALLDCRERLIRHLARHPRPIHSQILRTTRRLGRAPPNGQRNFPLLCNRFSVREYVSICHAGGMRAGVCLRFAGARRLRR